MSSVPIEQAELPNIMLGKSPERDQEIGQICQMIRNAGGAGIPAVKYNFTLLGVVRTKRTPDRGGALYSTFNYDEAMRQNLHLRAIRFIVEDVKRRVLSAYESGRISERKRAACSGRQRASAGRAGHGIGGCHQVVYGPDRVNGARHGRIGDGHRGAARVGQGGAGQCRALEWHIAKVDVRRSQGHIRANSAQG